MTTNGESMACGSSFALVGSPKTSLFTWWLVRQSHGKFHGGSREIAAHKLSSLMGAEFILHHLEGKACQEVMAWESADTNTAIKILEITAKVYGDERMATSLMSTFHSRGNILQSWYWSTSRLWRPWKAGVGKAGGCPNSLYDDGQVCRRMELRCLWKETWGGCYETSHSPSLRMLNGWKKRRRMLPVFPIKNSNMSHQSQSHH